MFSKGASLSAENVTERTPSNMRKLAQLCVNKDKSVGKVEHAHDVHTYHSPDSIMYKQNSQWKSPINTFVLKWAEFLSPERLLNVFTDSLIIINEIINNLAFQFIYGYYTSSRCKILRM